MSEQDVLKPQFTLEQIREAQIQLLSESIIGDCAEVLLASVINSEKHGKHAVEKVANVGALFVLFPEIEATMMAHIQKKSPAVNKGISHILDACKRSFQDAANQMLIKKMKD
jgi:hypothetical protein